MNALGNLMDKFWSAIISPAILIVLALGFLLFVYGLVEFLWNLNTGGDNKEGKQHMMWGIVGILVMFSVYGILDLLDNTFNLDFRNPDVSRAQNIKVPSNFGTQ